MKTSIRFAFACAGLIPLTACGSEDTSSVPPAEIQNIEKAADDAAAKISAENADDEFAKLKQEIGR